MAPPRLVLVRSEREGLLEPSLRAAPVPLVLEFHERQRALRRGQRVVHLQRELRRGLRFLMSLLGGDQPQVRLLGVGEREPRLLRRRASGRIRLLLRATPVSQIFHDRFFRSRDRLLVFHAGRMAHLLEALHVLREGIGILRVAARDALGDVGSDSQTQALPDVGGDLLGYRDDIGRGAGVLLAPDLCDGGDVNQLGRDGEVVSPLRHASRDHAAHLQLLADPGGIDRLALVGKHEAAGHDAQIGHFRQSVDQGLGDAVAEVLTVRILAGVLEGKNGHRVDG